MERGTFAGEVGRQMEEILPDFYVDGAHNVSAVRMFVQSIQRDRREKVVLFSAVREKNYEEMIRILCQEKSVSEYVITLIEDKRAAQTERTKADISEIYR